ncbi:MAG: twin-arginine translocase TatA/TatE family subunit [Leucobacter sp.]
MLGNLSGPTLLVILFIVLLLFGAPKLPGLAKSLGQSMRILKKEVGGDEAKADTANSEAASSATTAPAEPQTPPAAPPAADAGPALDGGAAPDKPQA